MVLANAVDSAQDLIDIGVKPLPARALMKFITKWKSDGLPADFAGTVVDNDTTPTHNSTTDGHIADIGQLDYVQSTPLPPVHVTGTDKGQTVSVDDKGKEVAVGRPKWMNITEFAVRLQFDVDYHKARCSDKEATQRLKNMVDAGNKLAKAYMSMLYGSGNAYIAYSEQKADQAALDVWTWLHTESAKGCPFAQYCLGCSLVVGRFREKSEQEALKYLRLSSAQGHPGAVCALGWCYQAGLGVTADAAEALQHYRQAANHGHIGAIVNMGNCYEHGIGTEMSETEAVRCYATAAEAGHPNAEYMLGMCYQHGKGVTKDETATVNWYQRAAHQNHAAAQFYLGECYEYGMGIAQDEIKAEELFQRAAQQGQVGAAAKLSK